MLRIRRTELWSKAWGSEMTFCRDLFFLASNLGPMPLWERSSFPSWLSPSMSWELPDCTRNRIFRRDCCDFDSVSSNQLSILVKFGVISGFPLGLFSSQTCFVLIFLTEGFVFLEKLFLRCSSSLYSATAEIFFSIFSIWFSGKVNQ